MKNSQEDLEKKINNSIKKENSIYLGYLIKEAESKCIKINYVYSIKLALLINNVDVIKKILNIKSDKEKILNTGLLFASEFGLLHSVSLLLSKNINYDKFYYESAIFNSISNGYFEISKLLLSNNKVIEILWNDEEIKERLKLKNLELYNYLMKKNIIKNISFF